MTNKTQREFDVVLWGASGFTGALVAEHLLRRFGAGSSELHWGLGGRNRGKLEALRSGLGSGAADLPIVIGDAGSPEDMRRVAERTRPGCTPLGP